MHVLTWMWYYACRRYCVWYCFVFCVTFSQSRNSFMFCFVGMQSCGSIGLRNRHRKDQVGNPAELAALELLSTYLDHAAIYIEWSLLEDLTSCASCMKAISSLTIYMVSTEYTWLNSVLDAELYSSFITWIASPRHRLPNNRTRSTVILRFGRGFALWPWTLPWVLGRNITCRYSAVFFNSRFLLHILSCYFTSLVKERFIRFAVAHLVACVRRTRFWSRHSFFFLF
jgi:hypothetical protein